MNMFLTHTMIRGYWYHDFTYSFNSAWLDTLVLLVITVIVSIVIENVKRMCGYNRLIEKKWFAV